MAAHSGAIVAENRLRRLNHVYLVQLEAWGGIDLAETAVGELVN